MKTESLQRLMESFEEERRYFESFALLVTEDSKLTQCRQRTRNIVSIVARIRAEMAARAQPEERKPGEAQRFDAFLQSALTAHLGLTPESDRRQEQQSA